MMNPSDSGRQRRAGFGTPRRGTIVAIALVLSLATAGVILGQRTRLSQDGRRRASPQSDAAISVASFDAASPSKEYVYAGGRLIATEEPPGGPIHHGSTIGLFRPSSTYFLLRNSNTTGAPDISAALGATTDLPVVGDWDGNGTTTIGVFRPGTGSGTNTFFLSNSSTSVSVDITATLGAAGDLPIVGDWNGDGSTTIGVFRPSTNTFFLCNSLASGQVDITLTLGAPGDLPIAGDWNGDGTTTIGVYRPSSSTFFLSDSFTSGQVNYSVPFGAPNLDIPILGDWDANGTFTVGVYRPSDSTFYLRNTNSTGAPDLTVPYGDGPNGDKPVAGDWDGV